ncbi:hypothetical protein G443_004599 [Actinoalloteichus cyanogriseus DSM 43889]|uniref:Uncharacterized protein n=1 Tax=Actinoalloteichus caeruleus DSM 43889 TaxID=1120930 RepID=A0ABT1JP89_ACTCY|nr:hypothetical protein [Actinoalloteichus caeruleus DSM 43889]
MYSSSESRGRFATPTSSGFVADRSSVTRASAVSRAAWWPSLVAWKTRRDFAAAGASGTWTSPRLSSLVSR